MKKNVAGQKQRGRNHGSDHAESMRGNTTLGDQNSSGEEQCGAGAIQGSVESGEVGVLLGNHAAGLVLRRFAISNANPNITSENRTRVATEEDNANEVSTPG